MDIQTIDQQYQDLNGQAQKTIQEIQELATKLQTAAQGGNQDAREWLLDLKSVALAIQAEQNQVTALLQALHGFIVNQGQLQPAAPQPSSPWGQQPPGYPQPASRGYPQGMGMGGQQGGFGGVLNSFLSSGFGRAIELGAGFGIGSDLINAIF